MLRRPRDSSSPVAPPTPAFEYEFIPVTRLEVMLGVGLSRSFDLEQSHTKVEDDKWLTITQGERKSRIPIARILSIDEAPGLMKRPLTSEQIAVLKHQ